MFAFFRCALLGLLAATGCTRVEPLPPRVPELPRQAWELSGPASDSLHAAQGPAAPAFAKTAQNVEPKAAFPRNPQSSIPGGSACLAELRARRIGFTETRSLIGVHTPVLLTAPLDGVRFRSTDGRRFEADCRLVLALSQIAPELRALGVTEVRYSGTYVYRYSRAGRLSNHAYGLAIDVHALTADNLVLEVKRDFARGEACSTASGLLNRFACRVRSQRVFPEQLGPDDNADHHDHFHFGLRPLPGELPAELPAPKPAPRRRKRSSRG